MDESRAARRGRNEAAFRQVNERISELADRNGLPTVTIVCECAHIECRDRVDVSREQYEEARQGEARFIVLAAHGDPSIERVGAVRDGYVLVEKVGEAAEAAAETDPRT